MKNLNNFSIIIFGLTILFNYASCTGKKQEKAEGKPWKGVIQKIPGKIQCEFYDEGGEGIAYHDQDSINNGSGKLNPRDGSFLNEYRMNEGVDLSYTKFKDPPIDNNEFNLVEPEKDQLYVGWTEPGEWINYTVEVRNPGTFQLGIMYTARQDGAISLAVDHEDAVALIQIPSTFNANDVEDWRQSHHWNYLDSIGNITLKEGIQTITLKTAEAGQMNYDFINFKRIN